MPALYTAVVFSAILSVYGLLKSDLLLIIGSLVIVGLLFFIKHGAEESVAEAYQKGLEDGKPVKEKVDNGLIKAVMMSYDLFEKGLQIAVAGNDDPENPRKLLVGKWEPNPFDRSRMSFIEVGLINRHGFRPIRRVEKKTEPVKPKRDSSNGAPPNFSYPR